MANPCLFLVRMYCRGNIRDLDDDLVFVRRASLMTENPLVSIVTPLYNQEDFVEETILSVLAQSYKPIEYIVVNDGSTDRSREILEKFKHQIKIVDQNNSGQSSALNKGWAVSSGLYIGYLSADDILNPTCIEQLVNVLSHHSDIVCAYPDCDLISEKSTILKKGIARPFDLKALVIEQECYIGPGALWRADAHRAIGGWKTELKLAPDREYWMRLAKFGKFHFLTKSLAGYRLHPKSISYKTTSEEISLEYVSVLDDFFAYDEIEGGIADRREEAYANAYWLIARNMARSGRFAAALRYLNMARILHKPSISFYKILILIRSSVGKPIRIWIGSFRKKIGK